jgi:hypothetical protein
MIGKFSLMSFPHDLALLGDWALRHHSPFQFAFDGLTLSVKFFKEKNSRA